MKTTSRRLSRPLIFASVFALLVAGGIGFYNTNHSSAPASTPTPVATPTHINTPYIPTRTPVAVSTSATIPAQDIAYIQAKGYMLPDLVYPGGTRWDLGDGLPATNIIWKDGYATSDDYKKVAEYYQHLLILTGYENPIVSHPTSGCKGIADCQSLYVMARKGAIYFEASVGGAKTLREAQPDLRDGLGNPFKPEYQALVTYSFSVIATPTVASTAVPISTTTSTISVSRVKAEEAFKADQIRQGYNNPLVPMAALPDYSVTYNAGTPKLTYTHSTQTFDIAVYMLGSSNLNAQQAHPIFRGVRTFYQYDLKESWRSLWWTEPGFNTDRDARHPTFANYVISAMNMSETEFWQIANSLSPAPGFSRTLAGVSLGMSEKEVLVILGEPKERSGNSLK